MNNSNPFPPNVTRIAHLHDSSGGEQESPMNKTKGSY